MPIVKSYLISDSKPSLGRGDKVLKWHTMRKIVTEALWRVRQSAEITTIKVAPSPLLITLLHILMDQNVYTHYHKKMEPTSPWRFLSLTSKTIVQMIFLR